MPFLSTVVFICASPRSKSRPIIRSGPPMTRQNAFAMKLSFLPLIVQVTAVPDPAGAKSNTVSAVDSKGRTNASLILTCLAGWLSTMVMLPSPTLSLPDHLKTAPLPEVDPSKATLDFGSSLAQGDQACQL